MDGYEQLLAAIVNVAINDYRRALYTQNTATLNEVANFFGGNNSKYLKSAHKAFLKVAEPALAAMSNADIEYRLNNDYLIEAVVNNEDVQPAKYIVAGRHKIPVRIVKKVAIAA